jgi:3-deoxy-manno-octulosonate cytidylyltransferase (CMP-KDO synthetase)
VKILAVIPARYNSQRFPGKPLVLLDSRSMVQWVYEATKNSSVFDDVVVATDSEAIADCVRGFGGKVEMTHSDHATGTDRVAEVADRYPDMDIIANVQGDQPFVTSEMLSQLVSPYLRGERPEMTTLACPLEPETGYTDPNVAKVICDRNHRALYFSRSAIPYYRNQGQAPVFQHLGLYAFRRDFLAEYSKLEPTPLEHCEGLEQLRVLEHGYAITVSYTSRSVIEINTPDDLLKARSFLASAR